MQNASKYKNYTIKVARNDDEEEEGEVNIRTNSQYLHYFESTNVNLCIKVPFDENIREAK